LSDLSEEQFIEKRASDICVNARDLSRDFNDGDTRICPANMSSLNSGKLTEVRIVPIPGVSSCRMKANLVAMKASHVGIPVEIKRVFAVCGMAGLP